MAGVMPPAAFDGTVDETERTVSLTGAAYTLHVSFVSPPGPPTATPTGTQTQNPVSFSPGMPGATLPASQPVRPPSAPRGGLVIMLAPNEFLIAGTGIVVTFTPNGPGTLPLSKHSSRIVAGHPEGFHEGFANIYSDAAEAIAARRSGNTPNPLALYFPNSFDGLMTLRFVFSAIASSKADGKWTKC